MRPLLFQRQTVKQPPQLTAGDDAGTVACRGRPRKAAAFQTSVVEPEAVVLPAQELEFVPLSIAEDEPGAYEQVKFESFLDQGGQTVNGLTHIGCAASQVNALGASIA